MKHLAVALVVFGAGLMSGCSDLLSLNEFVAEEEAVMDPALLGVWTHDDATFAIQRKGNSYNIRYLEKGAPALHFDGRLVKAGEAKLLDIVEVSEDPFVLPLHALVRVWTEGNTLHWTFLDSDWLKEEAGRRFAVHKDKKRSVITTSGKEWRNIVWQLAADEKAYSNQETATRVQ